MRLIALDLDGTLLNDEKELTEENRKALAECMERGIYIVPTTGRTLEGNQKYSGDPLRHHRQRRQNYG